LVGFNNLNVNIPNDIYDRINSVRQRLARVGKDAGKLTRVKEQGVAEDLDANQKRVGQLGPYEKVGPKGAVGKLVGGESIREGQEDLDTIRRLLGK
jgi:hypothetical protein